jgi:hypothetical protein
MSKTTIRRKINIDYSDNYNNITKGISMIYHFLNRKNERETLSNI